MADAKYSKTRRDTGVALDDEERASEGLTEDGVVEGWEGLTRDTGEIVVDGAVKGVREGRGGLVASKGHWRSLLSESESS